MSDHVLVGYCIHGIARSFVIVDYASEEDMEMIAMYPTVERSSTPDYAGACAVCDARFKTNMAILKNEEPREQVKP